MLSEKDKAVVFEMSRTGMSLETLKRSFPKFPEEDIEEIYNECNNTDVSYTNFEDSCGCDERKMYEISINCS